MKRNRLLAMAAALLLCCLNVVAQEQPSLAEIEAKAKQGDFMYMRALGKVYQRGLYGQPKDEAKARQWYRAAFDRAKIEAEKGDKEALNLVLTFYMKDTWSWVVERDSVEAMRWFNKAVDLQIAPIQYRKVKMDIEKGQWTDAVSLLQKLIANPDNKEKHGAALLGDCYYYGRGGLQRNYAMAYKYYKMSIDNRDDSKNKALSGIGLCYYYGRGVQKNVTQAVKYWKEARSSISPEAAYLLGECQIKGIGTTKDVSEGIATLKMINQNLMPEATAQQLAKSKDLVDYTEGEIARQQFLADQKRRQAEERKKAERERAASSYTASSSRQSSSSNTRSTASTTNTQSQASTSYGEQMTPCPVCFGTGQITYYDLYVNFVSPCPACGATGKVLASVAAKAAEIQMSRGSSGIGSHSHSSSSTRKKDCKVCHNTGICQTCLGKGEVFNSYTNKWSYCSYCNKNYENAHSPRKGKCYACSW